MCVFLMDQRTSDWVSEVIIFQNWSFKLNWNSFQNWSNYIPCFINILKVGLFWPLFSFQYIYWSIHLFADSIKPVSMNSLNQIFQTSWDDSPKSHTLSFHHGPQGFQTRLIIIFIQMHSIHIIGPGVVLQHLIWTVFRCYNEQP